MSEPAGDSALGAFDVLRRYAGDADTGWSLGTFGALAEFHRSPEEPADIEIAEKTITVRTGRGALSIDDHPRSLLVPYEGLSKLPNAWTHGILVCLPEAEAALHGRDRLTALGADAASLRALTTGTELYDLGLGIAHIDACVLAEDETARHTLDGLAGRDILAEGSDALGRIATLDPARVFASRLGRIEVYQSIPDEKKGERTPMGPHTHLYPELLRHDRTQSANIPVPDGYLPCLAFYPPNPIRDVRGDVRPFDRKAFEDFQALFEAFAAPELAAVKRDTFRRLDDGAPPSALAPADRAERTALRVALRQYHHRAGETETLAAWRRAYDSTERQ